MVTPHQSVTQASDIQCFPGLPFHSVPDVITLSMFSGCVKNHFSESLSVGEIFQGSM